MAEHAVLAWGDDSQGQLGSGLGRDRRLPTLVTDAAGQPIPNLPGSIPDLDGDGARNLLEHQSGTALPTADRFRKS